MSELISIIDYTTGNCDVLGCKYNNCGSCDCNDVDFLVDRVEDYKRIVKSLLYGKQTTFGTFTCREVKEQQGICIYCGAELQIGEELIPYGDDSVVDYILECPNGC